MTNFLKRILGIGANARPAVGPWINEVMGEAQIAAQMMGIDTANAFIDEAEQQYPNDRERDAFLRAFAARVALHVGMDIAGKVVGRG